MWLRKSEFEMRGKDPSLHFINCNCYLISLCLTLAVSLSPSLFLLLSVQINQRVLAAREWAHFSLCLTLSICAGSRTWTGTKERQWGGGRMYIWGREEEESWPWERKGEEVVRRGEEERKTGDRWMERSEKEEMEDKREKRDWKEWWEGDILGWREGG